MTTNMILTKAQANRPLPGSCENGLRMRHGITEALLCARFYCCVISRFSSASSSLITSPDTSMTT
ncbi:MAG: hypothetical protein ACK2UA_12710, partial [Anaerolineae bacterium]